MARACAAALLVLIVSTTQADADVDSALRATQGGARTEVIVKLKQPVAARRADRAASVAEQKQAVAFALSSVTPALQKMGVEVKTRYATLPYVGVAVDRKQLVSLLENANVEGVFLNVKERKAQILSNSATERPATERPALATSVPSVDVAAAWARGYQGQGVTIAVIDGGFRTSHPMLSPNLLGEVCFSDHNPQFDTYTQCPSGQTPQYGAGAASNCPVGSDRCDHGTHVASIALGNDGTNFGVARAAKFLPIDVFSEVRSAEDCSPDPAPCELTDSATVLKALDYINQVAQEYKIVAVNLSVSGASSEGFCDNDPRREVIQMLRAKGVATVVASGNESLTGKVNAPACVASAVAVGATNDALAVTSFSNISSATDLMAPGVSIRAASGQNNGFATMSGTSMSTPHVAGAFAIARAALPTKTVDEIEQAFKATGLKTTRLDSGLALAKLQVNKAILRLEGRDKRNFNNVLTSSQANTFGQSFLRFHNDSSTVGNVTVSMRDADTGMVVGTWTSPNIAPHASVQFDIANLETEARITQTAPTNIAARKFFNLEVESTVPGYMQHIVWARGAGVLTNLTACADGLSDDSRILLNVHSQAVDGYPSRIRIANTGANNEAAVLTFYNAGNGRKIGTFTTPAIPANASLEVPVSQIEAAVPSLFDPAVTGANLVYQYNVQLSGLTGYLQHVVENQRGGVLLDMSPKCDLGVR